MTTNFSFCPLAPIFISPSRLNVGWRNHKQVLCKFIDFLQNLNDRLSRPLEIILELCICCCMPSSCFVDYAAARFKFPLKRLTSCHSHKRHGQISHRSPANKVKQYIKISEKIGSELPHAHAFNLRKPRIKGAEMDNRSMFSFHFRFKMVCYEKSSTFVCVSNF